MHSVFDGDVDKSIGLYEDVFVRDLVLMALLTLLFLSLSTEHVFFVCVTCPCSFWTKRHDNLLVNNNNNNNNGISLLSTWNMNC